MKRASQSKAVSKRKPATRSSKKIVTSVKPSKKSRAGLKGQRSVVKLRKAPEARRSAASPARHRVSSARPPVPVIKPVVRKDIPLSPSKSAALRQYETAIKLLYAQEFERAKTALEKIIQSYPEDMDVLERAKSHLRLCEQRMARRPAPLKSVDDHYNWGIALLNEGRYEESREQLVKALKLNPSCDYVVYALATLNCRMGDVETALANLKNAIALKPENRYLARNDSDFEPLMHDPRFVSLVSPDQTATSAS